MAEFFLSSGIRTEDTDATFCFYEQIGGTLTGTGTIIAEALEGDSIWSAGTIDGPGVSIFQGGLLLEGNGARILSGGRTLNLEDTTTWTGNTSLNGNLISFTAGGATLNNTGTFLDQNEFDTLINSAGGGGDRTFNNANAYLKAGDGTTTISVAFNNAGLVDVQDGTLQLAGGGNNTGSFQVAPGALLAFSGGTHLLAANSSITAANLAFGGGAIDIDGAYNVSGVTTVSGGTTAFSNIPINVGALEISGGTIGFNASDIGEPIPTEPVTGAGTFGDIFVPTLTQIGGTLAGVSVIVVAGDSIWSGGTFDGTGTTTFQSDLLLEGNGSRILSGGRTLNLEGTTTWTGNTSLNGNIIFFSTGGGILNNTGTFLDQNEFDTLISSAGGGGDRIFNNANTYTKTGDNTTNISVAFNNAGLVDIQDGILQLAGGGTSSGDFTIAPGALLEFGNGNHTLEAAGSIAGDIAVNFGTVTVADPYTFTAVDFALNNGSLVLETESTFDTYTQAGGTLTGTGTLTVPGDASWSAGSLDGTGTTAFQGDLLLESNGSRTLFGGRTLNLEGTTTWTGNVSLNGNIIFFSSGGGTLNNTGTFLDQNEFDTLISSAGGGGDRIFNNANTYTKTGGNTTNIGVAFNNTGLVDIQDGILQLAGGGTSSGDFTIAPGALLEFGNGDHTLEAAGSIAGDIAINFGTVTVADPYTFTAVDLAVNNGSLVLDTEATFDTYTQAGGIFAGTGPLTVAGDANWSAGNLDGTGAATFQGDLLLEGDGSRILSGGRTLNLEGTTTWTGNAGLNGNIIFFSSGGGTLNNTGTFLDQNEFDTLIGSTGSGGDRVFNNANIYAKTGDNTTNISVAFNNTGLVDIQAGTFGIGSSDYTQTDGITRLSGGSFVSSSNLNINGGTFEGFGTATLNFGTELVNAGQLAPGLDGAGALTIAGTYTQQASGALNIELGGLAAGTDFDVLDIEGAATFDGSLNISFIDGFTPAIGDSFEVAFYDSFSGAFDTVNVAGDTTFDVNFLPDRLQLTAIAPQGNNPPIATDDRFSLTAGGVLTVAAADGLLANDSDPDADALDIALLTEPSNGTLALDDDGSFTYTPNAGFSGLDSFTYEVSDGVLATAATVEIEIASAVEGFLGAIPYSSFADSPFAENTAAAFFLETFEDGFNTPGVSADFGDTLPPSEITDSVDGDDGEIDGSGTAGSSFFSNSGPTGITFTFDETILGGSPDTAGIVWTDGEGTTTFEAFSPAGESLGTVGPVAIADDSISGTTAEDRFFGVEGLGPIGSIRISNTAGDIEVDHLQFGLSVAGPSTIVVDTLVDEDDGDLTAGDVSLREALAAVIPGGTVTFASELAGGTIALDPAFGQLRIEGSLSVDGAALGIVIDAQGSDRVLDVGDGDADTTAAVTLTGLTLTGGTSSSQGGGILNSEALTLIDSTVAGNAATIYGGGIANLPNAILTLSNSTITGNTISPDGSYYSISAGGGIANGGTASISNSTISGNTVYGSEYGGGGIANGGNLTLIGSTVADNSAETYGGGIFNYAYRADSGDLAATLTIATSTIAGNTAGSAGDPYGSGGGIANGSFSTAAISNSTIASNAAYGSATDDSYYASGGGGIGNAGTLVVTGTTVSGNRAETYGGGIFNYSDLGTATATIANSTLSGNTAEIGGAVANDGTASITNSTIAFNAAADTGYGGGIVSYGDGGALTAVTSSIVAGNIAADIAVAPPDEGTPSNSFASGGNNLIGTANDPDTLAAFNQSGDMAGNTDPGLDALGLQDNGGPTQTIALEPGSPAIDAGSNPNGFATDQRQFPRVAGTAADIGAFEFADDIPNNLPSFTSPATANVGENTTAVLTVTAVDADGDELTFSIVGGTDGDAFSIDAASGELAFLAAPNFEDPSDLNGDNVFAVEVAVSDGIGALVTQLVTAIVTDDPEDNPTNTPPVFTSPTAASVSENATAVLTVTADDADGDDITFAIVGGADGEAFSIDAASGELVFLTAPNFENPSDANGDNTFTVEIAASDGVGAPTTQLLTVVVADDPDDNPANTPPVFTSPPTLSPVEGTTTIAIITADDADADELTFSIVGGADSDALTIDAASGELAFLTAPDFEDPSDANGDNIFEIEVAVSDGVGAPAIQALAIAITDDVAEGDGPIRPGFNGDTLAPNDDGSTGAIEVGFDLDFFGVTADSVFVNNNGNITLDSPLATFTPFDLTSTGQQIIAPFFADVDTSAVPADGSQPVTFGIGTADGRDAFGANWIDVGYFNSQTDLLNAFQLVLIDRSDTGPGNFDIEFNYDRILWETGNASGGLGGFGGNSARVGFSNGTGEPGTFFELPGSAVNGAFLDSGPSATALVANSIDSDGVTGRYVFEARGGEIVVPAPSLDLDGSGEVEPTVDLFNLFAVAVGAPQAIFVAPTAAGDATLNSIFTSASEVLANSGAFLDLDGVGGVEPYVDLVNLFATGVNNPDAIIVSAAAAAAGETQQSIFDTAFPLVSNNLAPALGTAIPSDPLFQPFANSLPARVNTAPELSLPKSLDLDLNTEDALTGEPLYQLQATDLESDSITFSLAGAGSNAYAIAPASGWLRVREPDLLVEGTTTLLATASDGQDSDTIPVRVNVFNTAGYTAATVAGGSELAGALGSSIGAAFGSQSFQELLGGAAGLEATRGLLDALAAEDTAMRRNVGAALGLDASAV